MGRQTNEDRMMDGIVETNMSAHASDTAREDPIIEDDTQARIWATQSRSKHDEMHLDEDFTFANFDKKDMRGMKHGLHLLKQVRIFETDKRTGRPMTGGFGDVLLHNLRTNAILSRAKGGATAESLLNRTTTAKHEYEMHKKKQGLLGIGGED